MHVADSECCNAALYEPANHITVFLQQKTTVFSFPLLPINGRIISYVFFAGFILSHCCVVNFRLTSYAVTSAYYFKCKLLHCGIVSPSTL